VDARRRLEESGCLGSQPQTGGKPHPRLNTGEGPIANKYREGKTKRTLKRESKVLEIVEREAIEAFRKGNVGLTARGANPPASALRATSSPSPTAARGVGRAVPPGGSPARPSAQVSPWGWAHPSSGWVSVGRGGDKRPPGGWRG